MRRVREFVEVHLGESIDLVDAGRSRRTISASFLRDSLSNPPGWRRMHTSRKSESKRAQKMLVQTDLSLAEIAFLRGLFSTKVI